MSNFPYFRLVANLGGAQECVIQLLEYESYGVPEMALQFRKIRVKIRRSNFSSLMKR